MQLRIVVRVFFVTTMDTKEHSSTISYTDYLRKREYIEENHDRISLFLGEVSASTAQAYRDFMHKISLVSLGVIPLTITLLVSLIDNGFPVNEYKGLLFLGWFLLFIAAISGNYFGLYIADAELFGGYIDKYRIENQLDESDIFYLESRMDLLTGEQTVDLLSKKEGILEREKDIDDLSKSQESSRARADLSKKLSMGSFVLGLTFVLLYFSSQIFDF